MNDLTVFDYEGQSKIRVVRDEKGEPWFVAGDVCKVLGIDNTAHALARLDDDEKGIVSNYTLGGKQDVLTVNEPGLYTLILGSRKPEAKAFKRWLTHEVLPAIRANGAYALKQMTPAQMLLAQAQQLVNHEQRLADLEAKMSARESSTDYFTVLAYARRNGYKVDNAVANRIGRFASKISRENGWPISKTDDSHYGEVGSYHRDALVEAFAQVFGGLIK